MRASYWSLLLSLSRLCQQFLVPARVRGVVCFWADRDVGEEGILEVARSADGGLEKRKGEECVNECERSTPLLGLKPSIPIV